MLHAPLYLFTGPCKGSDSCTNKRIREGRTMYLDAPPPPPPAQERIHNHWFEANGTVNVGTCVNTTWDPLFTYSFRGYT